MQISCYFDANNVQLFLITMKSSKFSYSLNLRIQSVIEKKTENLNPNRSAWYMINKNNDDTLFMIVMFIQMRITFKFTLILLLLKNACSFMNLQENLHNAVHKKNSYFRIA